MSRPTIYFAPGSCAFATLVAFVEAGIEFEARKLVLADREQDAPWFRAINPLGRVPTAVIEGKVVTETIALLTYAATANPGARLVPLHDTLELASAMEFMAWLATGPQITIAQLWRTERFVDDAQVAEGVKAAAPARLATAYDRIEQRIGGQWALGDTFGVLDPYLGVFYRWGNRLGMDMSRYPRWTAQNDALSRRASVRKVLELEAAKA